ncbi:two-component system, NtrC family, C4-dicarboxylate transport sensor histidine kinase DctB [Roseivivax marinus]|uniref:sensor histidine kinase n=1 Tax=Roseivivax marinus TaxID=1379903 RepID=UPI0008D3A837|nr:ATP-binding protein [Roseivivax marinus]SEL13854.1 two-component system, NtrC family, C4-dicarboxylate transport sensor histidine kinase DctB [Roseivivax marinus]
MQRSVPSRAPLVALFLAVAAAVTAAAWLYAYHQALGPLAARGRSDLLLAADRLVTQLQRYREFAVLTADHPALAALHEGGDPEPARAMLREGADKTGTSAIAYRTPDGRILAAAGDRMANDVADAPFFRRAVGGALGARLVTDPARAREPGSRLFTYAAPQFGPDGRVRGVLTVSVDLARLEQEWRGTLPTVYFLDASGVVVATNRSEILGWERHDDGRVTSPGGRTYRVETVTRAGYPIRLQDWSPYVPRAALLLREPLPVIGLDAFALIDVRPARRIATLQASAVLAVVLFFGAILFLVSERRRALTLANAELETRVASRTRDLVDANVQLTREVAERQEAEAALKRAQAELVQAEKLSALGRMSAGISHELNQPLMAIRSFAENGAAFLERDRADRAADNFGRISEMTRRMGRIIRNLRLFARQESAPAGRVDLAQVVASAIELTEARARAEGVALVRAGEADPVWVRGGEVRLGQVVVNLITNALDAMADAGGTAREVTVTLTGGAAPAIAVADTGPGIEAPERLFDPFYSTKAVGAGMGLGLSISYGLVQSFGGDVRGENRADGPGAVFTVTLEPWRDAEEAA